jgi:hypothetical protein
LTIHCSLNARGFGQNRSLPAATAIARFPEPFTGL